jgi:hypothetical protein
VTPNGLTGLRCGIPKSFSCGDETHELKRHTFGRPLRGQPAPPPLG